MKVKQTISMLAAGIFLFAACQEADLVESGGKSSMTTKAEAKRSSFSGY